MNKFTISATNIEHLLSTEIEAETREEAIKKYYQMWEDGNIEVNKNELTLTHISN